MSPSPEKRDRPDNAGVDGSKAAPERKDGTENDQRKQLKAEMATRRRKFTALKKLLDEYEKAAALADPDDQDQQVLKKVAKKGGPHAVRLKMLQEERSGLLLQQRIMTDRVNETRRELNAGTEPLETTAERLKSELTVAGDEKKIAVTKRMLKKVEDAIALELTLVTLQSSLNENRAETDQAERNALTAATAETAPDDDERPTVEMAAADDDEDDDERPTAEMAAADDDERPTVEMAVADDDGRSTVEYRAKPKMQPDSGRNTDGETEEPAKKPTRWQRLKDWWNRPKGLNPPEAKHEKRNDDFAEMLKEVWAGIKSMFKF
ncbi:MAG: hypothetical protein ABIJ46_01145 [bacterium]